MIESIFTQTEIGPIPEAWKLMPLGKLCDIHGRIGFRGYTKNDLVERSEGAITFSPSDIHNQRIDYKDCDYISWEKYEQSPEIKVANGDILFCKTASIGKCALIRDLPEKATINPQFVLLNSFSCDNRYLYYVLAFSRFQERVLSITGGSTIPTMSQEKLKQQLVAIPPKEDEQGRIADALEDIDELIVSIQRLIHKKRDIRTGVIRELLTSDRRIKGYSDSWIKKNLGKSATIKARIGWQGLTTSEYLDTGDYYLITGTDFWDGGINWDGCHYVSKERFDQDSNIKIQEQDVLVTKDGTIGKVAYLDRIPGPGTLNSGVFVIRTKDREISQRYLAKVFISKYFDDFIDSIVAGSTIIHLYQKDIVKFDFYVPPTIEEQEAICDIIEDLDNEIRALTQKLNKYTMLKDGMMQQLLTGKIRLV